MSSSIGVIRRLRARVLSIAGVARMIAWKSRASRLILPQVALAAIVGCSADVVAPTSTPTSVTLTASSNAIKVGETVTLTVVVLDQNASVLGNQEHRFSVSDTSLATVSASGVLLGKAGGTVQVRALSFNLISAAQTISIQAPPSVIWSQVSAGSDHTCALTNEGVAYCWGASEYEQLGARVTTTCPTMIPGLIYACSQVPTRVETGIRFKSIYAGDFRTCALTDAGAAYCWGGNNSGVLGNGDTTKTRSPTPVVGGLTFTALSLGNRHTCGITLSGQAYCWGSDNMYQLGRGQTDYNPLPSTVPVLVSGSLTYKAIALSGWSSCGLTTDGVAYCWGLVWKPGMWLDDEPRPKVVPGSNPVFTDLAFSWGGPCALTAMGTIYCWGSNVFGEFGNGTAVGSVNPLLAQGSGYTSLSGGETHVCALRGSAAFCQGANDFAQLGIGTQSPDACDQSGSTGLNCSMNPKAVLGGLNFTSLALGNSHSCGITVSGALYCWGNNFFGQLGAPIANGALPGRVKEPVN